MPKCRSCGYGLHDVVLELGASPLANSYIPEADLDKPETYYPLKVFYCGKCHLVQLEEFSSPKDIFSDYDYFSSYSRTWLEHVKRYSEHMRDDYGIGKGKKAVEIASNDGYCLQYFLSGGVDVLGIEPAANIAKIAEEKNIPTRVAFFGEELAEELLAEGQAADLIFGNNVLAHVPNVNDFVLGVATLLKLDGVATFEFPHLLNLVALNQFDTIYHEHFSYFSLLAVKGIFERAGLAVFDVEELTTHGGSLRVFAAKASSGRIVSDHVEKLLAREKGAGLDGFSGYAGLKNGAETAKFQLLRFLLDARRDGKTVFAYGAAAKGNTLLNYAGIKPDLLPCIADLSPHKQGKFLPGSHIPIVSPDELLKRRMDYLLIMPWNISGEIMGQLKQIREAGAKFLTAIPSLTVHP